MRWLVAAIVVLSAIGGWLAWQTWNQYLQSPIALQSTEQYEVPPGTSLGQVALDLEKRGWLKKPQWFVWHARSRGDESRIRAGEYALSPELTPFELLQLFVGGDVIQHSFTIIEGSTFKDVRASLLSNEAISRTLDGKSDAAVMTVLGLDDIHPEGQFLPETYYFTRGTTDTELLGRANKLLTSTLEKLWAERDPETQLDNPYEALILASIIEKETALQSERREIAGVFNRRLAKGMRLQSDPTVIYGIGPTYDGDIRKRDLRTDTPYNTYTRSGLTPTPIAMAGAAAIHAALHPAPGTSLFFVATGDPDGSHYFSDTIDEHNKAVQRYLVKLRQKP
ncbi:MAG: endolytic transglycosylase MltG [Gammaproteobacteria bacterium]|nr:endolytic transglycosylase MltG [Gammaproteobacteria bacterium]